MLAIAHEDSLCEVFPEFIHRKIQRFCERRISPSVTPDVAKGGSTGDNGEWLEEEAK